MYSMYAAESGANRRIGSWQLLLAIVTSYKAF